MQSSDPYIFHVRFFIASHVRAPALGRVGSEVLGPVPIPYPVRYPVQISRSSVPIPILSRSQKSTSSPPLLVSLRGFKVGMYSGPEIRGFSPVGSACRVRAAGCMPLAVCGVLRVAGCVPRAAGLPSAACHLPLATCRLQLAACRLPLAAYRLPPAQNPLCVQGRCPKHVSYGCPSNPTMGLGQQPVPCSASLHTISQTMAIITRKSIDPSRTLQVPVL